MNILDYLPPYIPISKQMFFLTKDEVIEVGDVFYQEGPKLFVLRCNGSESHPITNNSEDYEKRAQDFDREKNSEKNSEINHEPASKEQKAKAFFPKPQVKGILRNHVLGDSQLSLGRVNKYVNKFNRESIGKRHLSEKSQNRDALHHHDDIQHLLTHELGRLPTFFLREDSINADVAHNELPNVNNPSDFPQLDAQLSCLLNSFEFVEFDENGHDISNYHVDSNCEEDSLQDLEEQFFSKFDEEYFEDFDEDFENINDFDDWLVIDSEILFQRDGIALVNCYAMPFYFWDIVLESFLLYELEGYVPSVKALLERLKNITSG